VSYSTQPIRHLPYFEALAEMDEADADWRATSAGLVVLRLIDAWLEEGPHVATPDSWGMRAVRESVQGVPAGSAVRSILMGVLDAMETTPVPALAPIAPRLMAYGRALDFAGKWHLAGDVFRTIVAHVHPAEDADVTIDANLRIGYCARMLGDLDAAAAGYAQAGAIAESVGDLVKVLYAQLGAANIAQARGNFPRAEEILSETYARAASGRLTEVGAMAMHARATIAHARGDYELSIQLAYDALNNTTKPTSRDRLLADIASSFLELGVRSAARDALLVLANTAQEQFSRWSATLGLMEIAALDGRETVFDQYRRELAVAPLPTYLEAEFHLYTGRNYGRLGRVEAARVALRRAIDVATRFDYNQIVFMAEEQLREVQRTARTASQRSASPPTEGIRHVADALFEMRELAGLGG
jgi:tetratricopeptide (TPR) repeat protein